MTELFAQLVGTWLQFLGWKVQLQKTDTAGWVVTIYGEKEEGKARIC